MDSFKYLGINLYKNGCWFRTQKRTAQHSLYALHNLFIVFNQLNLNTNDKCNLFDSLVGSVLNYGGEIWGYFPSKNVELIHTKFLRKILNVKKCTNLDALYGELGRYPMHIKRKISIMKYWIKILNQPDHSLMKQIYNMLQLDSDNNINHFKLNWAHNVKNILDEIGMTNIWIDQNPQTIDFRTIKQRIIDIYKQNWYANINNSSKLASYCMFKHDFNIELYLSCINVNKYRISLTKLRLSCHNLEIETGRYLNIPRSERICTHCNMNVIESEYHFLLVCPKYYEIRKRYLKKYYCHWPSILKFNALMSSISTKTINSLSKYVFVAMKHRER